MSSVLVTIGTDGSKDWVKTSDGQKFALGPVSILTLMSRLCRNSKTAEHALESFLKKGEAMVTVDDEHLWSLLAPHRSRWGTGPFMPPDQRRRERMSFERKRVEARQDSREVQNLNALAQDAGRMCDSLQASLHNLSKAIRRQTVAVGKGPDSRSIEAFLGSLIDFRENTLGWGGASFLDQDFIDGKTASQSPDVYESNMRLAQGILTKAQRTAATISRLASAGKRFDAARARADVATVTKKVASICSQTELTESWVRTDLGKLAAQNDRLHRLFHTPRL